MTSLRNAVLAGALFVAGASAAQAMPLATAPGAPEGAAQIDKVVRTCDWRGCYNKYTGQPMRPPAVYYPAYPRPRYYGRPYPYRYRYAPRPYYYPY